MREDTSHMAKRKRSFPNEQKWSMENYHRKLRVKVWHRAFQALKRALLKDDQNNNQIIHRDNMGINASVLRSI